MEEADSVRTTHTRMALAGRHSIASSVPADVDGRSLFARRLSLRPRHQREVGHADGRSYVVRVRGRLRRDLLLHAHHARPRGEGKPAAFTGHHHTATPTRRSRRSRTHRSRLPRRLAGSLCATRFEWSPGQSSSGVARWLPARAHRGDASRVAQTPPCAARSLEPKPTDLNAALQSASLVDTTAVAARAVHELAHAVRLAETTQNASASIPIFYLTAGLLLPEEIASVDDLGVTFVRKPLLFSKLRGLLQNLLTNQNRSPICTPRATPRKLAEACPVSILVVEDNKVNMKLALKMLQMMGYGRIQWTGSDQHHPGEDAALRPHIHGQLASHSRLACVAGASPFRLLVVCLADGRFDFFSPFLPVGRPRRT